METYRAIPGGWQSIKTGSVVSTLPPPDEVVLIDPASNIGVQPDGHTGWTLEFSDEFAGTSLDTLKWDPWYPDNSFWNVTVPGGHKSNTNEPQAYDPSALTFADSVMTMTMRDEVTIEGLPYTSGMVCSAKSFSTQYGYFEARMKLPRGPGTWPAFWLYPLNSVWPPEIDIMESWGGSYVGHHYIAPSPFDGSGTGTEHTAIGTGFNTFGLLWEPGRLVFYVNGVQSFEVTDPDIVETPMQVHCNFAGDKDNYPSASSLPASVEVDYIRVWKAD